MSRTLCIFHSLVLAVLLSASVPVFAGGWSHHVGFGLAGGEANVLPIRPEASISPLAGGAGNAVFLYEARANVMFVQFGLGVGYRLTGLKMYDWVESRPAVDITREELLYQYRYSSLREQQRSFDGRIKAMVGFLPMENFYLAVGLSLEVPFVSRYASDASMMTAGQYDRWAAEYISDRPLYGFYPLDTYSCTGSFSSVRAWVAPELEFGGTWDLGRLTLRGGVYADWGFRLGDAPIQRITNWSRVDLNAGTQTRENLKDNIRFSSLLDSRCVRSFSRLEVGLRLSVLFDVTVINVPCHCVP